MAARVVALPSWELFERQDAAYRESVLPRDDHGAGVDRGRRRPSAGSATWALAGAAIGIDHFGASAPAKVLYKEFGITAATLVAKARACWTGRLTSPA